MPECAAGVLWQWLFQPAFEPATDNEHGSTDARRRIRTVRRQPHWPEGGAAQPRVIQPGVVFRWALKSNEKSRVGGNSWLVRRTRQRARRRDARFSPMSVMRRRDRLSRRPRGLPRRFPALNPSRRRMLSSSRCGVRSAWGHDAKRRSRAHRPGIDSAASRRATVKRRVSMRRSRHAPESAAFRAVRSPAPAGRLGDGDTCLPIRSDPACLALRVPGSSLVLRKQPEERRERQGASGSTVWRKFLGRAAHRVECGGVRHNAVRFGARHHVGHTSVMPEGWHRARRWLEYAACRAAVRQRADRCRWWA